MDDHIITEAEKLQAENEILKQLLQEQKEISLLAGIEQRELEQKAAAGAAAKSYYDLQAEELKYVRSYIHELLQKAEAAAQREAALEKQITQSVSTSYQLEDIRSKYNHLQAQLNDLAERLQELHNQSIMQVQQVSRVAELESMLAIAEEEIRLLKNNAEEPT